MLDDNTTKLEEIKSECDIEEKIEDDENHKDINVSIIIFNFNNIRF